MSASLTRRHFGSALFAAGYSTAAVLSAEETQRGEESSASRSEQTPRPQSQPSAPLAEEGEGRGIGAEDLLLAAVVARYPSPHLTAERLQGIRAGLSRNLRQGELLRRVPLENGDGPATVFRVVPTQ